MTEEEARKRAKQLKNFYRTFGSYAVIVPFLFAINYLTGGGYWWAIWPALGLGVSLAMQGVHVFGLGLIGGKDWEERKVRELMDDYPETYYRSEDYLRDVVRDELTLLEERTETGQFSELKQRLETLEGLLKKTQGGPELHSETTPAKEDDYQVWTEHENDDEEKA